MKRNPQSLVDRARLLSATTCFAFLISCVDSSSPLVDAPPNYVDSNYGAVPASYQNSSYGYGHAGLNSSGTYHYYPRYSTYYSPQSRQYYYQRGNSWHTRTTPYGVTSQTLQSAHYVPLNIHGSPSSHHTRVVQSYPSNWSPPGQRQGYYASPSSPRRSFIRSF